MKITPLTIIGLALCALTATGLTLHVHQGPLARTEHNVRLFVILMGMAGIAFLLACRLVTGPAPPNGPLWFVLAVGLVMRLLVLTEPTFLSSDVYRYVWDGRVQVAGINPYRYIPADPALGRLRDDKIYPHINRREYAPTIYPPTAQLVFRLIASISQTTIALRLTAILFEALGVACLLVLLRQTAQPLSRILIYAWNPLAVWAYAGNGHVDALAVGLIPLALLARHAKRDILTGAVISAAILVKFLPVAIAPALWRVPRPAMPIAAAITIAALYGVYADAGARVFGFLATYGHEEHLAGGSGGSGIWLLAGLGHLVTLPPSAASIYFVLAGSLLAILALDVLRHPADRGIVAVARDAGRLAGATMIAVSPHYPWYFPFLGVLATLATSRALTWLSVAPLLLYLDPLNEFFFWPSLIYVPALIGAVRDRQARST